MNYGVTAFCIYRPHYIWFPFFQTIFLTLIGYFKGRANVRSDITIWKSRLCMPLLLSIFPTELLTICCNYRLWISLNYFINFQYPSYRLYLLFREFLFLLSFIAFEKKEALCFLQPVWLFPGWVFMQTKIYHAYITMHIHAFILFQRLCIFAKELSKSKPIWNISRLKYLSIWRSFFFNFSQYPYQNEKITKKSVSYLKYSHFQK